MWEERNGPEHGVVTREVNAEGVGQFQPGGWSAATTLGPRT